MKKTWIQMGMTINVEIADAAATEADMRSVYDYFSQVDERFSTYKKDSEISRINRGELRPENYSADMQTIFTLAAETMKQTLGYFNIKRPDGTIDPSGLVKGWAIKNAADLLRARGFENFFVDAGGDIEVRGRNADGKLWSIGIKDPRNPESSIVKTIRLGTGGVATSGTYLRGEHIYNPHTNKAANEIVSLTVIGPDVYEADRFATAAFAMGKSAIHFIESLPGLEGYMIDGQGIATQTSQFDSFAKEHA